MGKQKTAIRAGALIDDAKKWKSTDWIHARGVGSGHANYLKPLKNKRKNTLI